MTRPLVTFADAEVTLKDYLVPLLAARSDVMGASCSVGQLPGGWQPRTSPPHVGVMWDGTPEASYPVQARATVRLTTWAAKGTDAKRLCWLVMGLALCHPGGGGVSSVRFLTGPLPARDPESGADLASCTVRVNLRGVPLPT